MLYQGKAARAAADRRRKMGNSRNPRQLSVVAADDGRLNDDRKAGSGQATVPKRIVAGSSAAAFAAMSNDQGDLAARII